MRAWRRGRARLALRDILPCGLLHLCFCRCTHCSSVRYFCSWFVLYGLFAAASLYGLFAAAFGEKALFLWGLEAFVRLLQDGYLFLRSI